MDPQKYNYTPVPLHDWKDWEWRKRTKGVLKEEITKWWDIASYRKFKDKTNLVILTLTTYKNTNKYDAQESLRHFCNQIDRTFGLGARRKRSIEKIFVMEIKPNETKLGQIHFHGVLYVPNAHSTDFVRETIQKTWKGTWRGGVETDIQFRSQNWDDYITKFRVNDTL